VVGSLQNLWYGVVNYLPNIVGAFVVLVIGLIVAAGLAALVEKILEGVRLDTFLEKIGLKPIVERAGMKLRAAYFFGQMVYWFVVVAFLVAIADSLQLYALSVFLNSVLAYLPNVIAAVLIMLAAFILAHFLRRVVTASVMSAKLHSGPFLGTVTWWVIAVFGFLTALSQLGIGAAIIQTIITGFIAMLALAGGLAFGLGGKDYAHHLLDKLKDRTENRF
jgi:Mechanosensitive ion channel, conserved TM helix